MKVTNELSSGLSSLVELNGTILQQLRIHKNMVGLWGYDKIVNIITTQKQIISQLQDTLITFMLKEEYNLDLQNLAKLNIGQTVEEIFVSDRAMAANCYELCNKIYLITNDIELNKFLEKISIQQKAYYSLMNQQLELVRQMGTQLYLATRG
ncbi:hypothetical protein ACWNT8_10905 [Pigmentibacter ruber]|uniref:hypothetical protein n=1 Tax=Pigmentibacter ruber TaxID=2683196 RepID=UPI00131E6C33|nr:hypothetical protein [Pigmentibacter ruber]BFD32189.1 hypothetical protein GTC16762_18070 [Pigmentibacter ruber]